MARKVVAPDGTRWRVRRRWVEHRPRFDRDSLRDFRENAFDLGDLDETLVLGLVIGGLLFAALTLFVPLFGLVLDLVLLLVVLVASVVSRVVLRRPWTIQADGAGVSLRWQVRGWRASRRAIALAAARLEAGDVSEAPLPLTEPAPAL